jgi:hypothetical protein
VFGIALAELVQAHAGRLVAPSEPRHSLPRR